MHVALAGTSGYARISTWLDCTACADVSHDFVGGELIFALANRDLSSVGNWSGTGWTFSPGALTHRRRSSHPAQQHALTTPASAGQSYRVQLGLRTDSAGTFSVEFEIAKPPSA